MTGADPEGVPSIILKYDRLLSEMDACIERDSRDIIALKRSIADLEKEISKIYLVSGMILGCSIAALVISLLGAVA